MHDFLLKSLGFLDRDSTAITELIKAGHAEKGYRLAVLCKVLGFLTFLVVVVAFFVER